MDFISHVLKYQRCKLDKNLIDHLHMLMTFWLPLLGIKFGPYDWLMMAGANDTKSTRERKPFKNLLFKNYDNL